MVMMVMIIVIMHNEGVLHANRNEYQEYFLAVKAADV